MDTYIIFWYCNYEITSITSYYTYTDKKNIAWSTTFSVTKIEIQLVKREWNGLKMLEYCFASRKFGYFPCGEGIGLWCVPLALGKSVPIKVIKKAKRALFSKENVGLHWHATSTKQLSSWSWTELNYLSQQALIWALTLRQSKVQLMIRANAYDPSASQYSG